MVEYNNIYQLNVTTVSMFMVNEVNGVRKCFRYAKKFEGMLGVKGTTRGERRGKDLKGAVDHL